MHGSDRPLVTYVYSETPEARRNFEFFLKHGLHDQADFIFIFNGETDADLLLPSSPSIRTVRRSNTCYDLGSHAEVLSTDDLWRRYSKFILMNASVRGPFIPTWADGACWTNQLLAKITEEVKVRKSLSDVCLDTLRIYTLPLQRAKADHISSLTACWNFTELLANSSRAVHGLGYRQRRHISSPRPSSSQPTT